MRTILRESSLHVRRASRDETDSEEGSRSRSFSAYIDRLTIRIDLCRLEGSGLLNISARRSMRSCSRGVPGAGRGRRLVRRGGGAEVRRPPAAGHHQPYAYDGCARRPNKCYSGNSSSSMRRLLLGNACW